jgi:hypothetical protein
MPDNLQPKQLAQHKTTATDQSSFPPVPPWQEATFDVPYLSNVKYVRYIEHHGQELWFRELFFLN